MDYNDFNKTELIKLIQHKDDQLKTLEYAQYHHNVLLKEHIFDYINAVYASIKAGEAIMEVYNSGDFGTMYKNDASPVTKADEAANDIIVKHLKGSIPILSEEGKTISYRKRKKYKKLWIVDPLDGTKEFVKKGDDFTVNIALSYKGETVFGVIYVPVTKLLYVGVKDLGAYRFKINDVTDISENKLKIMLANKDRFPILESLRSDAHRLPIIDVKRPYTVVATKSHMNKETSDYIEDLKHKYPDVNIISKGSSLKFCAVAEGSADVYPRFGPTMEWDTAAGQAIVEAAGGRVIKTDLTELRYNRENLLNDDFVVLMENK